MAISRYLGSTKNLVGSALGLVGVLLHVFGVVGGVWPVVVIGLYLVGALAAPPEKIQIFGDDRASLREDLDRLLAKVRAARIPADALPHVDTLGDVLRSVLDRSDLDPDTVHGVTRLVRTDIPLAVEAYVNLPWWFAVAKRVNNGPSAAEELTAQLGLLEADAKTVATRFFDADMRKQADHTRYLRERAQGE